MYFLYDLVGAVIDRQRIVQIFQNHNYELQSAIYTESASGHYKVKNQLKYVVTPAQTKLLLDELDTLRKKQNRYNGSYKKILMLYNSFPDFD